ncbi:DUF1700 domain-containing protein [Bacillus sp. FJAT-49736]|uniref:HAAS signaling domain-containing protein n=1 Tax=Bacillus sp. FJAT-49736 TaxID=2833582 RepID=UPI001BCA0A44|nr:DUF1700 domain-containing protein [Bacillus sp. FJAT-49736]MBS4174979.1 DUF1700 domain-containing protein [Bacillus sp. FJAT-49736]
MGKNEFFKQLDAALINIPEQDRKDIMYDFEEHFAVGLESGKSEQEIIDELGDPIDISRDLLADYKISKVDNSAKAPSITRTVLSSIGLGFFNLVFILGPVMGIIGIYIGVCAMAVGFTLSPLLTVYSALIGEYDGLGFEMFNTLVLCGIGLILGVAAVYVGKFLYKGIVKYIQFNIRVILGR